MKLEGNTIILDIGEEITIKTEKQEEPIPTPEPQEDDEQLSFPELLEKFNTILTIPVSEDMEVYGYLNWEYNYAYREWNNPESKYFQEDNFQDVYEYGGDNMSLINTAYNAMQAWLMASQLAEYVPTYDSDCNMQTELFKLAYEIGGGQNIPLYDNYAIRSDVNKTRLIAAYICSELHQEYEGNDNIATFREELGGNSIPASNWDELGYENIMLSDEYGRRGYVMTNLGYLVNTSLFLPNAPGPRIEGTTVCELPYPTGDFSMDDTINDDMVNNWNMMAQTPVEEWNSYSLEKQNRLVNAVATITCTREYMFGEPKHVNMYNEYIDGYLRYTFEEDEDGDYTIDGPFSNLAGIHKQFESSISNILDIADNSRFPTQDPNYGRCRPGCARTREGGELNPIHGSKENELYNISIAALVADSEEERERILQEDGWAADSPRSYVSGHSAQIVAMSLILSQLDPDNMFDYMKKSYDYSVNRSIARFHWMSDIIYGRLFGTMIVPIIRAMDGMQEVLSNMKNWIENPSERDWKVNLIIENESDQDIDSTGEIRLYVNDHVGINTYLPDAASDAGPLYTFEQGENNFSGIDCVLNGEDYMSNEYYNAEINEVRFYDYRHWNNINAGFNATLDTSDPRCDNTLKPGGTYVIKITNV